MSGHLCLKWNNHSTAFLKSIVSIHIKEKYCDATIACQGKYFPVHRVILSTCSDYFEEMFERIQCPHPYIVFKDIEPKEMELLLNYMYRGEVNVVQEQLPTLIKAAEALKIKGLAVPDDLPSGKESSGKKRSYPSDENSHSKRKADERRKRRNSAEMHSQSNRNSDNSSRVDEDEPRIIKQEPMDPCDYESNLPSEFDNRRDLPSESALPVPSANDGVNKEEGFAEFPPPVGETSYIKSEDNLPADDAYDDQASSWSDFAGSDMQNLDDPQTSQQDDMSELPEALDRTRSKIYYDQRPQTSQSGTAVNRSTNHAHQCPYCDYGSYYSTRVKRHIMYKHTGERPFQCEICFKRFAVNENLQKHKHTHVAHKPFECSVCFKKFKYSESLKKHLGKGGCFRPPI